jgi:hypothetical protein
MFAVERHVRALGEGAAILCAAAMKGAEKNVLWS